jgi:hypothetical protein
MTGVIIVSSLRQKNLGTYPCHLFYKYYLSDIVHTASIKIYDMTGKQLKSVQLENLGESSINILSGELQPGILLYTMIVDGMTIDTKQMIISE